MPDQQQQINYGASPNDGQGDPLRDAFIKTDDNFDAIWNAGPVGSNVTVLNNTVAVVNTNGNLILRPNGVGVIQANASIMPDSANIRDLGAADRRWRRVYLQTLNTVDYEVEGNLIVSGNLTIQGDTIQIGNLVTDAKTLQLSNTAANTAQATGSGITVGAADNIATLLYNSSTDTWDTNIGFAVSGNVTADYFIGNGSALSGLPVPYTDSDVTALLSSGNVSTDIFTQGNIEAAYILGNGSQLTGLPEQYGNSNVTTLLANFGSNAIVTTGNIEAGKLDVQNGIGNAWTIYGQRISAPSGGEWRSEEDSGDDYITSANDGYINLQSLYADGNIASELHLEHGTAHIRIADGPFDDWYFLSGGTMTTPGHIIPQANGMYSLGNATNQWANLWVANNTIYLGGVAIGVTGNTLTVAGEPVLSNDSNSDITTTGNITAGIMSADYVQFLDSGSVTESYISETGFIVGSNNSATLATLQAQDVRIITDFNGGGTTWTFDPNGDLTVPNYINFKGNTYIGDEPGSGSPAFRIVAPLTYGATIETDSDISGNSWTWTFGADGVLGAPGNITANSFIGDGSQLTGLPDGTAIVNGTSQIDIPTANGNIYVGVNNVGSTEFTALGINTLTLAALANITAAGTITATGNITAANLVTAATVFADAVDANSATIDGNLVVDGNVTATADLTLRAGAGGTINFPVTGGNIEFDAATGNVVFPGGVYTGDIVTTGTISATGNITTGNILTDGYYYANGAPFTPGSNYGDSNVVSLLSSFGSNTVSTTGNITAANFIGNVSLTGNITGTSANVEIAANAYVWTFDNTGILTLPAVGGDEGGEINFGIPAANTTLLNTVKIDVYQDRIRFFDGSTKGVYIDLSQADAGVGTALGYLNIPQVTLSANTTAALADSGKHFYSTTSGNLAILIPTNANVAFPTGTAFTVVVQAAGNVLVNADTGVTLYMAGSSSAGNRTVGAYGMATVMKVASDTWFINGSGVY